MLSKIRENLSTWVITILVILVAIPLVFMGLGDYQSSTAQYAVKINDQVISNSQIDQEIFQYRQALQKNFGGQIPTVYTDNFIKEITVDYIVRTTLLDQMSRSLGLAFHNESILNDIYNTSAFKEQGEFSSNLYKSQLFRLNMAPEVYESYVYQKGITNQLRKSITETSILTNQEMSQLIKNRFQKRVVNYKIYDLDDFSKQVEITNSEIEDYYENNKNMFVEPSYSRYKYISISKDDVIKTIPIDNNEIFQTYQTNLDDGLYSNPNKYEILHVLIDNKISDDPESPKIEEEIYDELKRGASFENVISRYDVSSESKDNLGYMGKFILEDLPAAFSSVILTLQVGQISEPFISKRGIHIISLKSIEKGDIEDYDNIKLKLEKEIKTEKGSKKYYNLIDEITDAIYSGNNDLLYFSELLQSDIKESQKISVNNGQGVFSYPHVREELFKINNTKEDNITPPIFITEDRFILCQMIESIEQQQISLKEARPLLLKILTNKNAKEKLSITLEESRDNLNAGLKTLDKTFKLFSGTTDSVEVDNDLKNIFFNSNPTIGYQISALPNNKMVLFNIKSINLPSEQAKDENYRDFVSFSRNTTSESDFDRFYKMFRDASEIEIRESLYEN